MRVSKPALPPSALTSIFGYALRVYRFVLRTGKGWATRSVQNAVAIAHGRETARNERAIVLKYLMHLTGIRRFRSITCTRRTGKEGGGYQVFIVMNAIAFARATGLKYVHGKFQTIHHADRPMPEWVTAWEDLFNLGTGEVPCDPLHDKPLNYCYVWIFLEDCFRLRKQRDRLTSQFKDLIPEFRRRYYGDREPRRNEILSIAVHLRRGDITPAAPNRFIPTSTALRTLNEIRRILDARGARYEVRVFSQGEITDFPELQLPSVRFFLNSDPIWTIRELIESDIFVMGYGFFSYCAGLISDGVKIHPFEASAQRGEWGGKFLPGWGWMYRQPSPDWLIAQTDGSFNEDAFAHALSLYVPTAGNLKTRPAESGS